MHPNSDTEDKMEAVMVFLILTRFEFEAEARSSRNIALFVMIIWLLIWVAEVAAEAAAEASVKDFLRPGEKNVGILKTGKLQVILHNWFNNSQPFTMKIGCFYIRPEGP